MNNFFGFSIFMASFLCLDPQFSTANLLETFDDPTPTPHGAFGSSLAIDGNLVLIGAQSDTSTGKGLGQAHLFDINSGNVLHEFNDPTPTAVDQFGNAVAVTDKYVLVGDFGDDTDGEASGQAHLFEVTSGELLRTFKDITPAAYDRFGKSVAVQGENVLIGASSHDVNGRSIGQVHLFDAATGDLLQTFDDPMPSTGFGFGSALAIDGNFVLIGAPEDIIPLNSVGQAHLFDAITGELLHTFDDPTPTFFGDRFGSSVALHNNFVLIGAPEDSTNGLYTGQAHLFDATTGTLLQTFDEPALVREHSNKFGTAVDLTDSYVVIGSPHSSAMGTSVGKAHLFDADTGTFVLTLDDPTLTTIDQFGTSVVIEGNRILVGAPSHDVNGVSIGQAYLFKIPEPDSSTLLIVALCLALPATRRVAANAALQ